MIPTIFFSPMSIVEPTEYGVEFYYAVTYASPILLVSSRVRELILSEPTWVYLGTLIGIPSFTARSFHIRSLMLMFGVGWGTLVQFSQIWIPQRRERVVSCLLIGLVILISTRFMFSTLYIVWMSRTLNNISFALGIIAANVLGSDPEIISMSKKDELKVLHVETNNPWQPKGATWAGNLRFGVGVGCLIALTQWLLSSHAVLPRWIDMDPFLCGLGVIFSILIGILVSYSTVFVRSYGWWIVAVMCAPAILLLPNYLGIWAGYIVVCYLTSVWQVMSQDISKHTSLVSMLLLASLSYFLTNLGVIWSIAWCFVPKGTGGFFMRQRVGQVFTLAFVSVGLSYFKTSSPHLKPLPPTKETETEESGTGKNMFRFPPKQFLFLILLVLVLVILPAVVKRGISYGNVNGNGVQKDYIRGMIWAIRFGYNNFGSVNFVDVAEKIKEVGANTIGLVESDALRPFTGNRDIVEYLEEHLHMYSDFGSSTMNDTWGCSLLSVFPIVRADRYNQPSPDGEIACLIDASLDVGNGQLVDVIVTHFGNTEHYRDRYLQTREIVHLMEEKKARGQDKVIWLGYLTDKPGGSNYQQLIESGLEDVAPEEKDRYCLYLFHKGMTISNFERIEMTEGISDTEIQIADFKY
eukprot:TRINITY_DN3736_c0_g1_i20.p1 TRINITY_DN3736_c0_g1~~TRINITY_DN3736_c0_g1_i20.p1  ORF type:complete len:636 (+),score=110.02 TRINITY_DN3736_c0_g1_i20:266-2173(+)